MSFWCPCAQEVKGEEEFNINPFCTIENCLNCGLRLNTLKKRAAQLMCGREFINIPSATYTERVYEYISPFPQKCLYSTYKFCVCFNHRLKKRINGK